MRLSSIVHNFSSCFPSPHECFGKKRKNGEKIATERDYLNAGTINNVVFLFLSNSPPPQMEHHSACALFYRSKCTLGKIFVYNKHSRHSSRGENEKMSFLRQRFSASDVLMEINCFQFISKHSTESSNGLKIFHFASTSFFPLELERRKKWMRWGR